MLVHPTHGKMRVVQVVPNAPEEYIDGGWRTGVTVHAQFDRFIPAVRWRVGEGQHCKSKLIFHSYYLKNLEVENNGN